MMSAFFCVYVNLFPILSYYLIDYHIDIQPETTEMLKFWFPFFNKFLSYSAIVIVKFNLFMGQKDSSFTKKFNGGFKRGIFKCADDQVAFNLALFVKILFYFLDGT